MATVNVGHYILGTEGLALLRTWFGADEKALASRVEEMHRFAGAPEAPPLAIRFGIDDLDAKSGYARWSTSYDSAPNPLIRLEEPVVRAMIDRLAPGAALDAGCGTGRHTAYLVERGHRVIGIDGSPEMLARAHERVPAADLRVGDLSRLPVEAATIDVAVCALALTHLPAIEAAIAELARVLRPGGQLVLSDFHPTMLLLGGTGFFVDSTGAAGHVRSYHHPHARYLAAFRSAGLEVLDCAEPMLEPVDLAAISGGLSSMAEDAFRTAWVGIPNALIWQLARRA